MAGSHESVLSPNTDAAARASTPAPTLPVAMAPCEAEQPNHGGEMKFCEQRHSSVMHEDALQPVSRISQDTAPDPTPVTVPGPHHDENDTEQPELGNELHTEPANDVLVDVANPTPYHAEVAEKDCDDVEVGSRTDPTSATAPNHASSPSTHVPRTRRMKRHRQIGPRHRVTAISNVDGPGRKRRKVATPTGHPPKQKAYHGRAGTCSNRKRATNHADANYEEWPLPDAVLQRTQVNGQTTLQLQFTWATSCAAHMDPEAGPAGQQSVESSLRQDDDAEIWASETELTNHGVKGLSSGNTDGASNIYDVTRILARWKRGTYFLEWADGSTGWEPRRNIVYPQTIDDFEATYQGLNEGIDVLASRMRKGKQQWRVHWHGRPAREDCWVDGKLMDPARVTKVREVGFDSPRA